MSSDSLTDELLVLVGFLLTSARGLVDEPKSYGPFRLLDAAGRLLAAMDQQGFLDDPMTEFRSQIDQERFELSEDDALFTKLDELSLQWTELMTQRSWVLP